MHRLSQQHPKKRQEKLEEMKPGPDRGKNDDVLNSFSWHLKLISLLILMLGLTLLNAQGRNSKPSNTASVQLRKTETKIEQENFPVLKPLTAPGDPLNITVTSDDNLFDPIFFTNIPFDSMHIKKHKDTFKATRRLRLESCHAANCSANVSITWSMKGYLFGRKTSLIKYFPSQDKKKQRLITKATATAKEETTDPEGSSLAYFAFLQPTLTLSPVVDFSNPLPQVFATFTPIIYEEEKYGPAVHINNFWMLRKHLHKLTNDTLQGRNLTVELSPLPAWKVLFFKQFDESMRQQASMGFSTGGTADELKSIFLENNPYFLGLTALVSALHMIFEYLALANDVKFWRGRKDFKGLSLRTLFLNCYFQTIIFLYLYDSGETSWSVLLTSAIGLLMQYWKLLQCITVVESPSSPTIAQTNSSSEPRGDTCSITSRPFVVFGYTIKFRDSYDKKTRKHDETAMRWLIYSMLPILIAYSGYSLVYTEHKSWYSFFLYTQVQFIYFFGFAAMTPQIFVNYKLKTVGQLPWRTFIYKSLNTIIDDLFAFIIKMPWLHRLACFRDDIVFAILLYQRWIYPVDTSRMADDELTDENMAAVEQGEAVQPLENSKKNN